ncbi:MAG TPA: hypothetical protein VEH01_03640 [Nitrososphaerales archaeon]|nr:hypothetical protein [Nitrososphaerales archaeon]
MNRVGVTLLLAAGVGVGAILFGALAATHAFQSPAATVTNRSQSQASSVPAQGSGSGSNPLSTVNLPPSLFSGIPCHRCIMAHDRFWS